MAPESHCDACQRRAEFLPSISHISPHIDYFRCPLCHGVWTQPKPGQSGTRIIITSPRDVSHKYSKHR